MYKNHSIQNDTAQPSLLNVRVNVSGRMTRQSNKIMRRPFCPGPVPYFVVPETVNKIQFWWNVVCSSSPFAPRNDEVPRRAAVHAVRQCSVSPPEALKPLCLTQVGRIMNAKFLFEQTQLNRLQMVQFECPSHTVSQSGWENSIFTFSAFLSLG